MSQLLGMISAGHVVIGHLRGSHHLRRFFHEVINIIMLRQLKVKWNFPHTGMPPIRRDTRATSARVVHIVQ